MPSVERIVTLAVGLLLGIGVGWWIRSQRRGMSDRRMEEELRGQLAGREAELRDARGERSEAAAARAAAEARLADAGRQVEDLRERCRALDTEAVGFRTELGNLQAALATARAEAEAGRQLLAEQRRVHELGDRETREAHQRALEAMRNGHEKALAELKQAFTALSTEALRQSAPEFLRLAQESLSRFQETAKGDLATREERIATLVKPLEEHLKTYQQRLQQSEAGQSTALGEVRKQLEQLALHSQTLSSETQRLRVVLSSSQARGRWGEETLRRVIEASGLSTHCDFTEQLREGDAQPDLVVHLPGDRVILVDSKVPDLDFLEALNTADQVRRAEALAAHAGKLRATIKALADRDYPARFPKALDYVVLFLPAESLFSAALEGDQNLILWAAERRILLSTPASLIALLRSVAVSWQQHEQSRNARDIADAARTLYERTARFIGHFERIRDGIARSARAYDEAVGSYERMVRPAGERLVHLGAGVEGKEPGAITPLDATLRLPPTET